MKRGRYVQPLTSAVVWTTTLVMVDKVPTEVGQRLRAAREHAGISANALSVSMDPCPGRAWAGWVESGEISDPSVDALRRAAKVLGVREEWLILGIGEMLTAEQAVAS